MNIHTATLFRTRWFSSRTSGGSRYSVRNITTGKTKTVHADHAARCGHQQACYDAFPEVFPHEPTYLDLSTMGEDGKDRFFLHRPR